MQNKRGLSSIIATVLLILLAVGMITAIFAFSNSILVGLAPTGQTCQDITMSAEIIKEGERYTLAIVNRGGTLIAGINLQTKDTGNYENIETHTTLINQGASQKITLTKVNAQNENREFLIIPIVFSEDGTTRTTCDRKYGVKTIVS